MIAYNKLPESEKLIDLRSLPHPQSGIPSSKCSVLYVQVLLHVALDFSHVLKQESKEYELRNGNLHEVISLKKGPSLELLLKIHFHYSFVELILIVNVYMDVLDF